MTLDFPAPNETRAEPRTRGAPGAPPPAGRALERA